jgi:CDP-diacylglycerol--glycerol-3-phosphate 3-phosphatidyltransferase/cardiolipin synthase
VIPDLISLSRIPMAVAFFAFADHPVVSVAILCMGGISDWLDGWAAKRLGQQTRFGALLDPVCDRLFIVTVLFTLVVAHGLPLWQLAVLLVRDLVNSIGSAVVWLRRPDQVLNLRARRSGKVVTSLQFWCVVHIVLGLPFFEVFLTLAALATVWALADYSAEFRRLLGASKSVSTP